MRHLTVIRVFLTILLVSLLTITSTKVFSSATLKKGVVVASVRDDAFSPTSSSLQKAKDMGLSVFLFPLGWDRLEVRTGEYEWWELDDILHQAARYDLKVVLRIYNAPVWHKPLASSATHPPTDPLSLYNFMFRTVSHVKKNGYSASVLGYVIWNEPNIPEQWGGQDANAGQYMQLLTAAYEGAKAADPDAVIVSAGLAPTETGNGAINDLTYLNEMYDYGLANYADYIGMNGLGFQHDPDYDTGTATYSFSRLKYLHNIMLAKGDTRKVWALEVGWLRNSENDMGAFNPYKVSPLQQTQYIARAFQKAEDEWPWLDLMTIWNLDFNRYYPPTSNFYWYNISWNDSFIYLPIITK